MPQMSRWLSHFLFGFYLVLASWFLELIRAFYSFSFAGRSLALCVMT